MPVPNTDVSKVKEVLEICSDPCEAHFNLGKKISVPMDLMMEELNLLKNRGSIMFQERNKRSEKYTLENAANRPDNLSEETLQDQNATQGDKGEHFTSGKHVTSGEHFTSGEHLTSQDHITKPGEKSMVAKFKHKVFKKGSPDDLAPGYGGPLTEVPCEKFNFTVIPKSYESPWEEKLVSNKVLFANISPRRQEPPQKLAPANFKCFNRAPTPFWGMTGIVKNLPGFELQQAAHIESSPAWKKMCRRPNFNRIPRGWNIEESPDL